MSVLEGQFLPEEPVIPRESITTRQMALFDGIHKERLYRSKNISTYDLPNIPDEEIIEAYNLVQEGEQSLVSPHLLTADYDEGTALTRDDMTYLAGRMPILCTTEHATAHYRRDPETRERRRKGPDYGTAGLGYALHHYLGSHLLTMVGRQTRDANFERLHPFKRATREVIERTDIQTVVSIHGMAAGKFSDFADERAFDVLLGIGPEPDELSITLAEKIRTEAETMGLRVAINEWFVKVADHDPLIVEHNDAGNVEFGIYAAPEYTMRAHVQRVSERQGRDIASVQVELSSLLRYVPSDFKRSEINRHRGVHVGFTLLKNVLERELSD